MARYRRVRLAKDPYRAAPGGTSLSQKRHSGRVLDEDPEVYFRSKGFGVAVEERDLYAEAITQGTPGRASFFKEGRRYYCVTLLRQGAVVAKDYAHGETPDDALREARRRYASEQG